MRLRGTEPAFDEHNDVLHAVLGLLAARRAAAELLDGAPAPPAAEAHPGDDALLHAALGLVRLCGLVDEVAATLAVDAPTSGEATQRPPSRVADLLR